MLSATMSLVAFREATTEIHEGNLCGSGMQSLSIVRILHERDKCISSFADIQGMVACSSGL